jgi:hypothetical protein
MKKLVLLSLLGLLLGCSKTEVDCVTGWKNYQGEVTNANGNIAKINMITQVYRNRYPGCGF